MPQWMKMPSLASRNHCIESASAGAAVGSEGRRQATGQCGKDAANDRAVGFGASRQFHVFGDWALARAWAASSHKHWRARHGPASIDAMAHALAANIKRMGRTAETDSPAWKSNRRKSNGQEEPLPI